MHGGWTTGMYKGHPSEALSKYCTDQSDHPDSREKIPPFFSVGSTLLLPRRMAACKASRGEGVASKQC